MIYSDKDDIIDKSATLERLKTEVSDLAKSFAGITSSDESVKIVPKHGKSSDGYFMPSGHDSIEPLA